MKEPVSSAMVRSLQTHILTLPTPDAAVKYWGAAFTVPDGAKLKLEGQFPTFSLHVVH